MFKKKSTLHCYTYNKQVYDLFPVSKTINHMPKWWKNLETHFKHEARFNGLPTMKSCSAVNKFLTKGITIPMWTDASLGVAKVDGAYGEQYQIISEFGDGPQTNCEVHRPEQMSTDFLPEAEYINFKIHTPWVFETDDEIEWVWTQPTYNFSHPDIFTILPGVIEFKYNHNVFLNLSMRKSLGGEALMLNLDAGDPMVNLIPLTDKPVDVKLHLVSKEQWFEKFSETNHVFFKGNYKKLIKLRKEKESKCPFGFGGTK
jgi:hypothetical protein